MDVLYFNGRFTTTDEPVIRVEDRGYQFGDGIYEVIKFLNGRLVLPQDHFRRMTNGLAEIEITNPWTEASFYKMCDELLQRTEFLAGIVYVQVTRGVTERVHFCPADIEPVALAYTRGYEFPDAAKKERGISTITAEDSRWKYCNVKSVNLLGNVLAKRKAQQAGAEEALLMKDQEVKEGASTSFFAVRDGRLITHPADTSILPGTVRDHVISLALEAKIRVDERPLREDELFTLDEAFVTSTTLAVMPVSEIDGRIIGNSRRGEITSVLQELYDQLEEKSVRVVQTA
ncbi:MAG: aminotransferase class IV [Acidobacteriota bacterium]